MTDENPNEQLFFAIAFSDRPGGDQYIPEIESACEKGADPDGFSEDGETPLTGAILGGMGSPKAVEKLLQLGADPGKRDRNGWTPWGACISRLNDRVVADRMKKIKKRLLEYEADRSDEIALQLEQAVTEKKHQEVQELLEKGIDPNAPFIGPLGCAIGIEDIPMIELLLKYKADPDGKDEETNLMQAAVMGNLEIVKHLVEAGADVSKYAYDDKHYTAEFFALENGHEEIAAWLRGVTLDEVIAERRAKIASIPPKFAEIYEKQTNGVNYDISTDDIIEKLTGLCAILRVFSRNGLSM